VPMSRIDLVVNGAIRERQTVAPDRRQRALVCRRQEQFLAGAAGQGHYADKPEIIAAHSTR